jgi:pimeloyl-ACP methyl ester carboxylesterase
VTVLNHRRSGAGEPLVLIHGIGSQWQMWEPVRPLLERERDVIAIDLPGFGDSPPLPGRDVVTPPELANTVEGFLEELGLDRPHVAGNSLGGWITLELAKRGRTATATALSPGGFTRGWDHQWLIASLRASRAAAQGIVRAGVDPTPLALGQMVGHPIRVPVEDRLGAMTNLARSPGWAAALRGLDRTRFTGGEQVPGATTTVAWGEKDRLLLPHQADRAREQIPQARHILLAGCGHVPTWDDPEVVARAILTT